MKVLLLALTLTAVFLMARSDPDLIHLLRHVMKQDYFHTLPTSEQVVLVELLAEGETGHLSEYIHRIGPQTIRNIAHKLPQHESDLLVHYIQKHTHHPTTTVPV